VHGVAKFCPISPVAKGALSGLCALVGKFAQLPNALIVEYLARRLSLKQFDEWISDLSAEDV
jgi:hypothetical protein